jgi:hypothetical protein
VEDPEHEYEEHSPEVVTVHPWLPPLAWPKPA